MVGRIWTLLLGALIAASLAGCGQDAAADKTTASSVVVRAGAAKVVADGTSTTSVRATVRSSDGLPVVGVTVDFATTLGTLAAETATTDDNGVAATTLSSTTIGKAEISANVAGLGGTAPIEFVAAPIQTTAAAHVTISASKATILSNNSDQAEITVTVLDESYAVIAGVPVKFEVKKSDDPTDTTIPGQLTTAAVRTDDNGAARTKVSSGGRANRVVTVIATVPGVTNTVQYPVVITGSSITLGADSTVLISDGSAAEQRQKVTVTAIDGAGLPVNGVPVKLSLAGSGNSPGTATLTPGGALNADGAQTTDVRGQVTATVAAGALGTVTVTAQGVGVSGTKEFTISQRTASFRITAPTTKIQTVNLNDTLTISVAAPGTSTVVFATTVGKIDGLDTKEVTVTNGTATATFSSAKGGTATIDVIDKANKNANDRLTVMVAAPSSASSQITLQANAYSLPISSTGSPYTVTLFAAVTNANGIPVFDQPVSFSVNNATGGGEFISPAYGRTDAFGQVTATFTSGSKSSVPIGGASALTVTASFTNPSNSVTKSATIPLVIGGTAGSVAIGAGTVLSAEANDTAYKLPMSVIVTDSNGTAVSGATVSLSVWPSKYRIGHWDILRDSNRDVKDCVLDLDATIGVWRDNPDTNRNLVRDTTETWPTLSPEMAAAGAIQQSVQTGPNGLGTFDLTYLKGYAAWVTSDVVASTRVLGTETTVTLPLILPYIVADRKTCLLPNSPFGEGPHDPTNTLEIR